MEESGAKSDEPPQRDASDAPSKDSEEEIADPPEAIVSEMGLSAGQVVHTGEAQENADGTRVNVRGTATLLSFVLCFYLA